MIELKHKELRMNNAYLTFNEQDLQVSVLKMTNLFIINYNYLVIDKVSKKSVIIDPAWDMEKIDDAILASQSELSGILLTHSHPDHIHLAKPLAAKYQCPIWMSNEEITISGYRAPQLVGIDRSSWMLGHLLIKPIFTPGHSPGSNCYLIGENLFTGDTLFAEGCGLCTNISAAHAMYESLQILKQSIKGETRIFPGHSYGKEPGQKFSRVLNENMYLQFKNKNDFAAYRLRKGQNKLSHFNFR